MNLLHLHIIANENAGSGNGLRNLQLVKNYLTTQQVNFTIHLSEYAGHAITLTQELAKHTLVDWDTNAQEKTFPLLVALGGDGTVFEVQNGLKNHPNIPFAYIPSGSGNDFARSADIPRDPIVALKQILEASSPTAIYSLSYHEALTNESFIISNNLGIGLDAAIVAKTNESKNKTTLNKLHIGSLAYLFSMIGVLFKQKGFALNVQIGKESHHFSNAFLVTNSKHPYFGGGVKILPNITIFEPELELIVVEKISYIKLVFLLIKLSRGKHLTDSNVTVFRSKEIHLNVTSKQYGQMNGEVIQPRPFETQLATIKCLLWK